MDAYEATLNRLEVRDFEDKDVPVDVKRKVLEAARKCQSGKNTQHWRFVLVEKGLERLSQISTTGNWVSEADFAVIVVTDPKYSFHEIDAGRVAQNMQIAAWSFGIGSCIYTGFDEESMRSEYDISDDYDLSLVIGFGYPETEIKGKKTRKPLEEIVFSEKMGKKLDLSV